MGASDAACLCCRKARGYIYVGPAYTTNREARDNICPWSIHDGSAAERFDAEFTEALLLHRAGISRSIIDAVLKRTPGCFCWQSQQWQAHCSDACAHHGDASVEDVANAARSTIDAWKAERNMTDADWKNLTTGYEPKDHSAFTSSCVSTAERFVSDGIWIDNASHGARWVRRCDRRRKPRCGSRQKW